MSSQIPKRLLPTLLVIVSVWLAPATVLAEPGPSELFPMSKLNPTRPAPNGFLAPSLQDDWRFRAAINGWITNTIVIEVTTAFSNDSITEDVGWLLSHMRYYVPLDFEARNGSLGAYFHMLLLGLKGADEILGPVAIEWEDSIMLFDVGISWELGRWRLGDEPGSPELSVEPMFGARIVHAPLTVRILGRALGTSLSSQVPVIGLRTVIDLDEHWHLEFLGDYGGWGVDDNEETWQGMALLGYRWLGWGTHWNLQVGYRAMRFFDLRKDDIDVVQDSRGPTVIVGVEF